MEKTIAGVATALGIGAISIIRVSGEEAINIVNKIFIGENLKKAESHTIHYGFIVEGEKRVDEVLVSIMRAPRTYTKEDVVEINCHGGIIATNKTLEILLANGCELAEPGEFTKRAFLNGRIDLIEAEGVMNLINSQTELNRAAAFNQLQGSVSARIEKNRKKITDLIAHIAVNIDYPEYEDIEEVTVDKIKKNVRKIKKDLLEVYQASKNGKLIQEGINTVIIGSPNVGKSSLLNVLIEENKAIVTDIAGTTRDLVEGKLNLDGVILNLIDTAGIRKTKDKIEKIGVQKSLELIKKAELILLVLDNNKKLDNDELKIIEKVKDKNHIIVINKIDLKSQIDKKQLANANVVEISTFEQEKVTKLKEKIKEMFNLEKIQQKDLTYLTSARSIALLQKTIAILEEIESSVANNQPVDVLEIDLKRVWHELGLITGKTYEEEIIEQLFANFCLGK